MDVLESLCVDRTEKRLRKMSDNENNEFDGKIWAGAIKSIGKLEGEFKYIHDTLEEIKDVLKDCPKHQMRTANLETKVDNHLTQEAAELKRTVDLRASRVSIIIGTIMFLGNIIVVSSDKILAWIWKLLKGT